MCPLTAEFPRARMKPTVRDFVASRNRLIKTIGQGIVMMALVLGLFAFVGNNKSIVLVITDNDQVSPALSTTVDDGSAIQISKAMAVDVVLNGADTVVHTTGSTVGDVVTELGVEESSAISADLETRLRTLSSHLEISTPKSVAVTVDGSTAIHTTTEKSVEELLDEADIQLGDEETGSASRLPQPLSTVLG